MGLEVPIRVCQNDCMIIGYARVSTEEQNLDLQLDELNQAGCDKIYQDEGISGASFKREGLDELLNRIQSGDTLVVWNLDRLGRSLSFLCELIESLGKKNVILLSSDVVSSEHEHYVFMSSLGLWFFNYNDGKSGGR